MQAGRLHHKWRASKSQEDTSVSEAFNPYHAWLGIPPEEQPPNHYRLLGAALFEVQADVIDTAADRQMAHLRTFQCGKHSDLSQRLLNEVSAARLCLLNSATKADYDQRLRNRMQPALGATRCRPGCRGGRFPAMGGHPRLRAPDCPNSSCREEAADESRAADRRRHRGGVGARGTPGPQRHSSGGPADCYDRSPRADCAKPARGACRRQDGT